MHIIQSNFPSIAYYTELQRALQFVLESLELSTKEKRRFFNNASTNLGTSALCLLCGVSFGYYHFGVAKAFLDAGLLPRVIAGTFAGGLVATLVCTCIDVELKTLLILELTQKLTACEDTFNFCGVWVGGEAICFCLWQNNGSKLELTMNFKVIHGLKLLLQLLGQDWSSVFLQHFDGAVIFTIWLRMQILDWLHILSNSDSAELEQMIKVGQIVT
ncbi:hypothetical protein BD769DRAFT_1723909 [Suillus cothurnatus]|nr:hypothetical protein BD769DRAFT_1723909 [Suillus cothurnatus]